MNWQAIGAVGEIGGAVGVILTLIYLAKQIRHNSNSLDRANEFAQASSVSQLCGLFETMFASISNDPQFAAIYRKALEGESIDPVESVQFTAWVNRFLSWIENNFVQHRLSLGFDAYTEESAGEMLRPYIAQFIAVGVVREWWAREGQHLYSKELIDYVESSISEYESSTTT